MTTRAVANSQSPAVRPGRAPRAAAWAAALALAAVAPAGDALAQARRGAAPARPAAAQAAKRPTTAPAVGPSPSLRLPPAKERTLPNGLRVVYLENREQPVVTMAVMVRSGASSEPAEKAGLAQMTAALLDQGTDDRTAQQIAETIDSAGGALGASAGWDASTVTTTVLKNRASVAADLLADVITTPAFKPEEIERVRTQTLNALQVSRSDAGTVADQVFERLVLGGSPYGHPIGGTPESVRSLTRDDMVAFHRAHFVPGNATVAIVGDLSEKEAFDLAERHLGAWAKGEPPAEPKAAAAAPAGKLRIVVLDKPDAAQTEIRAGMAGIPRSDPDYFAAIVTNAIFGATPFTSRIENELRVKRGLTYGAGSHFDARLLGGTFAVETSTKTETTAEALGVILEEIARLRDADVPPEELSQRKKYLTGTFLVSLETPEAVASRMLQAELFGLGSDYLNRYAERVEAVSAADVRRIARARIVPDQFVVVLAGNAAGFADAVKKFGPVETIPFDEVDLASESLRREAKAPASAGAGDPAAGAELAARTVAALGGDRFVGQKTAVLKGTGKVTIPSGQTLAAPSVVTYNAEPHKTRTELNLGVALVKQWSDGERAWVEAPGMPAPQEITAQVKNERFYGVDVLRRVGKGYTARALADAEVDGKAVKVLAVADEAGHETVFYVDPQTALPVRVSYDSGNGPVELRVLGYADAGGVKVPARVERWQNGSKVLELDYTDVQVDVEVDPALFAAPAGQ